MMSYINDHVITYIDKKMSGVDPALKPIQTYGITHNIPIITNDVYAFLKTQIHLKSPKKILEIGTAIGYSGSAMLLNSCAHLTTIDINEQNFNIAEQNFKTLKLNHRVKQILGDASSVLDDIIQKKQTFDFIFIDAAKGQYLDYFLKAEQCIESGGIILADNVLFKGVVAGLPFPRRQRTIYNRLNSFIDYVCQHETFNSSLLSIGDGMLLSIRKAK